MVESSYAASGFHTHDTGLAVLRVEGPDATAFLNAQTTAQLVRDGANGACPAALANAKGRVLAVFHAWHTGSGWQIAIAASQSEWLQNHLERYVLRSKVHIVAAPEILLLGVCGAQGSTALAKKGLPTPRQGQVETRDEIDIIGLAGERWLAAGNESALAVLAKSLDAQTPVGNFDDWTRARLAVGEVEIRDSTRARFLPQMLGLVELGAVSFRKGCYPGQEIIARARRGTVKRALVLVELKQSAANALLPGAVLQHNDQRLEILDSIPLAGGSVWVQAVATL